MTVPAWHDCQGIQDALAAAGAGDVLRELQESSDLLDAQLILPVQQYRAALVRYAELKQRAYAVLGGQAPTEIKERLRDWRERGNT